LVRREIQHGKASARQKLEVNMARACNKLNVPNYWIDLEPITGSPEVLSFDPFDSYDHVERAVDGWNQIYASHPDLAKTQEEINALLTSERTIVAERRDDLSYREDTIDLSEARFMRVTELHFSPGHEGDFVQTFKILNAAYEKTKSEVPWVVYQTSMGSSSPGFLVFIPLANLKQNDAILLDRGLSGIRGRRGLSTVATDRARCVCHFGKQPVCNQPRNVARGQEICSKQ
jgi:hypothetical protein